MLHVSCVTRESAELLALVREKTDTDLLIGVLGLDGGDGRSQLLCVEHIDRLLGLLKARLVEVTVDGHLTDGDVTARWRAVIVRLNADL